MSIYYRNDEEKRGYSEREDEGRYSHYPYSESHDYRRGWEDAARDERRQIERREEQQQEEQQREREEHNRQMEREQERQQEEEDYYNRMRREHQA